MQLPHWLRRAGRSAALAHGLIGDDQRRETAVDGLPAPPPPAGRACPNGGIKKKDYFLIGMSQANNAEPYRQVMNDDVSAAAESRARLRGGLLRCRPGQQQTGRRRRELPLAEHRSADHLAERGGAADRRGEEGFDKGIPVIVLDRKVEGDAYTRSSAGTTSHREGRRVSRTYAKTLLPDRARSSRSAGWRARHRRRSAPRASVKASPGTRRSRSWPPRPVTGCGRRARVVTDALFKATPDVDAVYAHNDPMAEAAIISAEGADLDLDSILFIGIDGLPTPDGGIRSVLDGRIDVTYVYPTGGEQAIDYAVKILEQGAVPRDSSRSRPSR